MPSVKSCSKRAVASIGAHPLLIAIAKPVEGVARHGRGLIAILHEYVVRRGHPRDSVIGDVVLLELEVAQC